MSQSGMDRVAVYMNHRGLDWDQLAMLTHISEQRLTDLATGRQGSMTLSEANRIARAVDCGLGHLFGPHTYGLDPESVLAVEMARRLAEQLGPIETLRRLTSPHYRPSERNRR